MLIDARGCACPEPVLKTKKGLLANPEGVEVIVDNNTAKENIKRFAGSQGYNVDVQEQNEDFILKLTR
jgi:tRNA 2-thiouridine synthesizing protein A